MQGWILRAEPFRALCSFVPRSSLLFLSSTCGGWERLTPVSTTPCAASPAAYLSGGSQSGGGGGPSCWS